MDNFPQIDKSGEQLTSGDQNHPTIREIPAKRKMSVKEVFADWRGRALCYEAPDTPTIKEWGELI